MSIFDTIKQKRKYFKTILKIFYAVYFISMKVVFRLQLLIYLFSLKLVLQCYSLSPYAEMTHPYT